jgi:hypothetical protein
MLSGAKHERDIPVGAGTFQRQGYLPFRRDGAKEHPVKPLLALARSLRKNKVFSLWGQNARFLLFVRSY